MNKESSRSHAIFTALIKVMQTTEDGIVHTKCSRFHIIDLAGSERVKETGADGQRLKEANKINNSLSVLGQVIYDLSMQSTNETKRPGQ
jgi:Kinesin motor domain